MDVVANSKIGAVVAAAQARVRITDALRLPEADELKATLSAMAAGPGLSPLSSAATAVVAALLGQHTTLRLLRHIPVLVNTYQWVNATFAHRVSQEEALDMTVSEAINAKLDAPERPGAHRRLQGFVAAWRCLQEAFLTYALDCNSVAIPRFSVDGQGAVKLADLLSPVRCSFRDRVFLACNILFVWAGVLRC